MELEPGTYTFGPSDGKLLIKTGRAGAAFLVGKSFTIEVTEWEGKLEVGDESSDSRVELTAAGGSLEVTDGDGGPITLTDLDKESLSATINEKVLDGTEITFHSNTARPGDDGTRTYFVGQLKIHDETTEIEFELAIETEGDEEEEEDEADGEHGEDDDDAEDKNDAEDKSESEHEKSDEDENDGNDGEDDEDDDDDSEPEREHRVSARATFKQSEVGLEPHSTLLGLLRVRDEVEVTFEGKLET